MKGTPGPNAGPLVQSRVESCALAGKGLTSGFETKFLPYHTHCIPRYKIVLCPSLWAIGPMPLAGCILSIRVKRKGDLPLIVSEFPISRFLITSRRTVGKDLGLTPELPESETYVPPSSCAPS